MKNEYEYHPDQIWNILKTHQEKLRKYNEIKDTEYKKRLQRPRSNDTKERKIKLLSEGWKEEKTTLKTITMTKPREYAPGESLEHDVWRLLYKMGFDELNALRDFRIPNGPEATPKQIDVFAKDDLCAVVIECKEKEKIGIKKDLITDIERMSSLKNYMTKEIRSHYKPTNIPSYFVGYVLITKNIDWTEAQLKRARDLSISVLTYEEIQYFHTITELIGNAARYQFLGELFSGKEIPKMKGVKIPAIRGKYKKTNYYQFAADAMTLIRIGFIQHRAGLTDDGQKGYQRLVKKSRLKNIAEYINKDNVFPTNIVINIRDRKKLLFEQTYKKLQPESQDDLTLGMLTLPDSLKSAWIIDGQHRLLSYFNENTEPHYRTRAQLPVIAFENLTIENETNMFTDINNTQKSVARSLVDEIEADVFIDSPTKTKAQQALATKIILALGSDKTSPLRGLIKEESSISKEARIVQTENKKALLGSGLIGQVKNNHLTTGALNVGDEWRETLKRSVSILSAYISFFKENCPENWNLGDKPNKPDSPGGLLSTTRGIAILFYLLGSIIKYIESKDSVDFSNYSKDEILSKINNYLLPVVDYFNENSFTKIDKLRRMKRGTTAASDGARDLEIAIKKSNKNYNPAYLKSSIINSQKELLEDIQNIWDPISEDLFKIVTTFLTKEDPDGAKWFETRVPPKLAEKISKKYYSEAQNVRESLTLSEYFNQNIEIPGDAIIICRHYIQEFQDLFNQPDLKWLEPFRDIRNALMHKEAEGYKKVNEKMIAEMSNYIDSINRAKDELGITKD